MKHIICLTLIILGVSAVRADSWAMPSVATHCSANKKYCLKVEPRKLERQLALFGDKVDGKDNAGAAKTVKDNYCKGTFNANGKKLWNVRLDNEVAPVRALVSDNGDYVITFDNWHSVGYGDNVVAIYSGQTGALIRKLGLSDFLTESDISRLSHSASSIWWSGPHEIDYDNHRLILKVDRTGNRRDFFDVRVNLKDGAVLDEVKDRFPSLNVILSSKLVLMPNGRVVEN